MFIDIFPLHQFRLSFYDDDLNMVKPEICISVFFYDYKTLIVCFANKKNTIENVYMF